MLIAQRQEFLQHTKSPATTAATRAIEALADNYTALQFTSYGVGTEVDERGLETRDMASEDEYSHANGACTSVYAHSTGPLLKELVPLCMLARHGVALLSEHYASRQPSTPSPSEIFDVGSSSEMTVAAEILSAHFGAN
jgi:hypothetical protein